MVYPWLSICQLIVSLSVVPVGGGERNLLLKTERFTQSNGPNLIASFRKGRLAIQVILKTISVLFRLRWEPGWRALDWLTPLCETHL